MKKIWRIFAHEYLRHVLRKRFIFSVLSLPLFVAGMALIGVLIVVVQYDGRPVGYVDQAGWLTNPVSPEIDTGEIMKDIEVVPFASEDTALEALKSGKIQAYYVFKSDYLKNGAVQLVANEAPSEGAQSAFKKFVRINLVSGLPKQIQTRLLQSDKLDVQTVDGSRQVANGQWVEMVIPVVAGILFMFVVNMTGGYLLRAVVEEKENRTMEIVITSVSPTQLMAGKIAGNLSVGLTQLFLWLVFPVVGLLFAGAFIPEIRDIQIATTSFWLTMTAILPAFVMVSALMAAIGATATESREASQVAGWFTLPLVVPYWFMSILMKNPNGPLSIGLSLFPLTAPVTLPIRIAFTTVPNWQIILSIGLLYICSVGSIWLAGRAFRLGMLRYGKSLSLRELLVREKKAA